MEDRRICLLFISITVYLYVFIVEQYVRNFMLLWQEKCNKLKSVNFFMRSGITTKFTMDIHTKYLVRKKNSTIIILYESGSEVDTGKMLCVERGLWKRVV